jgi:hypothetical protein
VPAGSIGASQPATTPERVVLISIAGLSPEHYGAGTSGARGSYRHGNGAVVMPRLEGLAAAGVFADGVVPVMPAAPYPVHATLVTGQGPARHGLLGDEILTDQGPSVVGVAAERRIKATTLWRAAQDAGLAVTALGWLSTLGSSIELLLPDLGAPGDAARWPALLEAHATPWIYEKVEGMTEFSPEMTWPTPALQDSIVRRLACDIARQTATPRLWLLRFHQTGAALALHGPGSDLGRAAFGAIDRELGELLDCFAAAGLLDSTALVVTGDRVLFPVHTAVSPNVALEEAGLITKGPLHLGTEIASWQALARSHGGSAVIYAVDESAAVLARRALEAQAGQTRGFRVVSAGELAQLSGDPQAWFGLEAVPGFVIAKPVRRPQLQTTALRARGGFLPTQPGSEVGFVAWGSGVQTGVRVPQMSQLEIAPTLSAWLGIQLEDAEAGPLIGILGATPQRGQEGP